MMKKRGLIIFFLLTMKPMIYVANVSENDLSKPETISSGRLREHAESEGADHVVISGRLEADLVDLEPEEAPGISGGLGVTETGLGKFDPRRLSHARTDLILHRRRERGSAPGLSTKARRRRRPPGEIHSDIQRGFIRAQVIALQPLYSSRL